MPERFLILGASSFYGSNFSNYVEERGDEAIRCNRYEIKLHRQFDYIVNFASKSLVAESWLAPDEWAKANVADLSILINELHSVMFKKFVHVSTPESYGHTDGWVDEEYRDWRPSTPYGVTRAAADMMLMAYNRARGFPAVITRTANIYGPGQGKNRIIPLAFDKLRAGEKINLHAGGHTLRCFIHVRDACAATYLVAKHGSVGQTYHISTTREITIANLVRLICKQLGKHYESSVGTQPDRVGKDHAYLLKSDRIRRMGWKDTISLERGIEEYART